MDGIGRIGLKILSKINNNKQTTRQLNAGGEVTKHPIILQRTMSTGMS
jgi:hypothetical protein